MRGPDPARSPGRPAHVKWTPESGRPPLLLVVVAFLLLLAAVLAGGVP
ncbi:MAG TPA: hypothetical protein P5164_16370 [Thermoanaerobaculia bacterium]|nr:hypothetical protein [Thermoanaerobaculia bacterium]